MTIDQRPRSNSSLILFCSVVVGHCLCLGGAGERGLRLEAFVSRLFYAKHQVLINNKCQKA